MALRLGLIAKNSRQQLLDAAIDIIVNQGEARLNVRDVAEAAGLSVAMIRHYFVDREGLVVAARAEDYRRSILSLHPEISQLLGMATSAEDLREKSELILDRILQNEGHERRLQRLSDFGSSVHRPDLAIEMATTHRQYATWVAAIFTIAKERGWLRDGINLQAAALLYISIVNGRTMVETWADEKLLADWDATAKEMILDLFLKPLDD